MKSAIAMCASPNIRAEVYASVALDLTTAESRSELFAGGL